MVISPILLAALAPQQSSSLASPVLASPAEPEAEHSVKATVKDAERLIVAGRLDEARTLLDQLESADSQDSQIQFLLALLDRHEGDYDGAIARFRRILIDEPNAVRVRLELGRTFFEAGDYFNAERQFRFARAGKLPESVIRNVDRYLFAIRSRKTFSFGFSFAVSPDSNLNAGPATDTVTLYGLPFELSQDARANSGVGLIVDANAEWAPRISQRAKLRIGAQVHRAQYNKSNFNDMTVAAYIGPRLNLKRWEFDLQGRVARRWYGDRVYTDVIGGSVAATHFLTTRMGIGAGLTIHRLEYPRNPLQTGNGGNISLTYFYTPTPSSIIRATAIAGRQQAAAPQFANDSLQLGLSYVREFKGGLTIALAPSYTRIAYDAPLAAFNATRVDNQYTGQVTLLSRRIDIYGLTPKLVYTYTKNRSSLPLFQFSRSRLEIGITRAF